MNLNHPNNQSYWFVVKEDQSNVILSSNNFTIHNPQVSGQEASYVVDTGNQRFIHINEVPIQTIQTDDPSEYNTKSNEENDFWDSSRIKIFLSLCLENNYKNSIKFNDILDNIATQVGTTTEECRRKFNMLRRTYKKLVYKRKFGKEIKWEHFPLAEKVFTECRFYSSFWDDAKVRKLLELYLEKHEKFRKGKSVSDAELLWPDIALQMGTTWQTCYRKFNHLKHSFMKQLRNSHQNGKPIKWPYYHYFEKMHKNYQSYSWNSVQIKLLIGAYQQMADRFRNPTNRKKDLWKEISLIVGVNPFACDRKFRNLKRTYLQMKMRMSLDNSCIKWKYFEDFENIYSPASCEGLSDGKHEVKQLLQYYVDNKHKFRDPRKKNKSVWRPLAQKLSMSPEECDKKFRNLKHTYIRLSEKNRLSGYSETTVKWPYFSYFEKIYEDQNPRHSVGGHISETVSADMDHFGNKRDVDISKFDRFIRAIEDSNNIQRERNKILQALLQRSK